MSELKPNAQWLRLWNERGIAVQKVLGATTPPGEVFPFHWNDYLLPGASAMTFAPRGGRSEWLCMSLGLTQPLEKGDNANNWEFCVRSRGPMPWVRQMLYDLLTYYLSEKGQVERGMYLPLVFFLDRSGEICAGLTEDRSRLNVVGEMNGLYLWDDCERSEFQVSSGSFGLLTAIAVTSDEDRLAQEATPPHLLLLLAEMGVGQLSDPHRESVTRLSGAQMKWDSIRQMSHDDVVRVLQQHG